MRKAKNLVLKEAMPLSEMEMIQVKGGNTSHTTYSYGVRCDQRYTYSRSIPDGEKSYKVRSNNYVFSSCLFCQNHLCGMHLISFIAKIIKICYSLAPPPFFLISIVYIVL